MKQLLTFLKATLLGGVIFVLPAIKVMQCISKWGSGSDELVAALDAKNRTSTETAITGNVT